MLCERKNIEDRDKKCVDKDKEKEKEKDRDEQSRGRIDNTVDE